MKKIITMLFLFAGILGMTGCEERKIDFDKLPDKAQAFIETFFSKENIIYAEKERDDRVVSYHVKLGNGTEIDFDSDGNWRSIESDFSPIPEGIIPMQITDDLKTRYGADIKIFDVEKEYGGYKIRIDIRTVYYDEAGNFIREETDIN